MDKKRLKQIEKRIEKIKASLYEIQQMRPGSLTKQYRNPKSKTGAYYQLSYTLDMKSRTEYIRKEDLAQVRHEIKNHRRFKKLTSEWNALSIEHSKLQIKIKPR